MLSFGADMTPEQDEDAQLKFEINNKEGNFPLRSISYYKEHKSMSLNSQPLPLPSTLKH